MHRALAPLAGLGLALAACSVDVEGAPCGAAGTTTDCPSGQACGNDGRCSERAAQCAAPETRCTPGPKQCGGANGTARVEWCTDADPVCGTLVVTPCAANGLVCDASAGEAACVPVPCPTPGPTPVCPPGQACGNDLKCSTRAAECGASRCSPGAKRCGGAGGTERVEICTAADPACGTWETATSCAANGLACDGAAEPTCPCPAPPASALFVDAGAGSDPFIVPTGAESPPACRLASIAAALGRATQGTTVSVVGAPGTYSVPQLQVPKGVALVAGDSPLDPASRILDDSIADGPGVVLAEGSRLAGFTVRATAGAQRPLAVRVGCNAVDKVTLEKVHVAVAGGASLARGIELVGGCDVDLVDVEIAGATEAGLWVGAATSTAVTTMQRGSVRSCQTGVVLTKGDLRLDRTVVSDNTGTGIAAGDGEVDTQFTAIEAVFSGNADTALVLRGNSRLDLQGNRFCGNGAVTPRGQASRKVGGIFALGAPPGGGALVFKGNEIHGNAADQVLISSTPSTWNLDGGASSAACSADRNLFLGYSGAGRGLVTTGAYAVARWNGWEGVTPTAGSDYEVIGTGSIDAGVTGLQYCDPAPAARACP